MCDLSNTMNGTHDDAIYDGDIPAAQATTEKEDDDSDELDDRYDDNVQCTDKEFCVLFGDSDYEEPGFEGFDWTVLTYLATIVVMFDNLYGIVVSMVSWRRYVDKQLKGVCRVQDLW